MNGGAYFSPKFGRVRVELVLGVVEDEADAVGRNRHLGEEEEVGGRVGAGLDA